MRKIIGLTVFCFCLMTVGCGEASEELRAKKEVEELKADKTMLVPDWFRAEFSYINTPIASVVGNSLVFRMAFLHYLLTMSLVFTITPLKQATGYHQWCDGGLKLGAVEVVMLIILTGLFGVLGLSVVGKLVCSIVVPIVSSGSWVPFEFIHFVVMGGWWVVVISIGGVVLIHWLARNMLGGKATESASANVVGVNVPAATRRKRMLRAMMKAGFVAVASAIGAKIGGWIGGVLVFIISAGISAYFEVELPSSDSDQ